MYELILIERAHTCALQQSTTAPQGLFFLQMQIRSRQRLLRALFSAWKGTAMVSEASLRLAEVAAAGRARRQLAEGFSSWSHLCTLRQRQGTAVARFAEQAAARRCADALAEWAEQAQRARLQRARLEQFMQRYMSRLHRHLLLPLTGQHHVA